MVKEFKGIEAESAMVLELLHKTALSEVDGSANPKMDQAPIINFIEVIREDSIEVAGIWYSLPSVSRASCPRFEGGTPSTR